MTKGEKDATIGLEIEIYMPYVSQKQERFMNAEKGKKVPAKIVDEFNEASRGLKLPEKAPKKK